MKLIFCIWLIAFSHCAQKIVEHANWNLLDHENCGESVSDRIIGGTVASLGQFPWMARIGFIKPKRNKPPFFKCGGSLISNLYVVTAAHCVTELKGEQIALIRLGEYNTSSDVDCEGDVCAPPTQDFTPAKIMPHANYQKPPLRNDIALIRLDRPAKLNSFVSPICLPRGLLLNKDRVNSIVEVAGWGVSSTVERRTSSVLLHVRVPIVTHSFCNKTLGKYATLGRGQLCAGGQIGKDSCGGDSGGPLMTPEAVDGPPKYYLIGVVSFGSAKCGSNMPAVYTDVAEYIKWILDKIEP